MFQNDKLINFGPFQPGINALVKINLHLLSPSSAFPSPILFCIFCSKSKLVFIVNVVTIVYDINILSIVS